MLCESLELEHKRFDLRFRLSIFICFMVSIQCVVVYILTGGDIPLNAPYTLEEISINFITSEGLKPNDISLRLRRAQAQIRLRNDFPCNVVALANDEERCCVSTRLPAAGWKKVATVVRAQLVCLGDLQGHPKGRPLSHAGGLAYWTGFPCGGLNTRAHGP